MLVVSCVLILRSRCFSFYNQKKHIDISSKISKNLLRQVKEKMLQKGTRVLFSIAFTIILFLLFFPEEAQNFIYFVENYSISSTFDYTTVLDGKIDWNSSIESFDGDYNSKSQKTTRVFDRAEILNDMDAAVINEKANVLERKYNADFVVVTENSYTDPYQFAKEFYKTEYQKMYQQKKHRNAIIVVLDKNKYYICPFGYVKHKLKYESGKITKRETTAENKKTTKFSFLDILFNDSAQSKYSITVFNAFSKGAASMTIVKRNVLFFSFILWIIVNGFATALYKKIRFSTEEGSENICRKLIIHARHVATKLSRLVPINR